MSDHYKHAISLTMLYLRTILTFIYLDSLNYALFKQTFLSLVHGFDTKNGLKIKKIIHPFLSLSSVAYNYPSSLTMIYSLQGPYIWRVFRSSLTHSNSLCASAITLHQCFQKITAMTKKATSAGVATNNSHFSFLRHESISDYNA